MFFPNRIKSIKATDRVLEIGPGGSPHPRSDVLLEKAFETQSEAEEQRGYTPELETGKLVVFYEGGQLPFKDKEFNYVICSHVLEHVEDVDYFLSELTRIADKGYIEYPLIYYEYIYNFKVHKNILHHKDDVIYWVAKKDTHLNDFLEVQDVFYKSLVAGHNGLISSLHNIMFEGYEWFDNIKSKKVTDIKYTCLDSSQIVFEAKHKKNVPTQFLEDLIKKFRKLT